MRCEPVSLGSEALCTRHSCRVSHLVAGLHPHKQPRSRRDEETAAKLQEGEVEEVHRFIKQVSKRWYDAHTCFRSCGFLLVHHWPLTASLAVSRKKPKIVCSDVEEGMLITVALPYVDSMKVHVDEVEKVITVVASPDFSYIAKFRGRIPEHMQPKVGFVGHHACGSRVLITHARLPLHTLRLSTSTST